MQRLPMIVFLLGASCTAPPKAKPARATPTPSMQSAAALTTSRLTDMGYAFLDHGNREKASKVLEKLELSNPNDPETLGLKALNHLQHKRLKEALNHYQAAINGGNQRRRVFDEIGSLLDALGFYSQATTIYESYLANHPGDDPMRHQLALSMLAQNRVEAAAIIIESLAAANYDENDFYVDYGFLKIKQGKPSEAFTAFDRVFSSGGRSMPKALYNELHGLLKPGIEQADFSKRYKTP